ncbi:MAG: hypothetical protein FGF52_03000 [Candidatus Brockarchaeota archaeon]|nr:hypothetical protein [Candidatus Brockarchaeota archaeon]
MDSEKIIVWSLRLITIAIVLVPLAFYYFNSGSLRNFIMPSLTPPSNLMSFNPNSLRVTSLDYHITGNRYLLRIGLFNAGNMGIGLKEVDGRIFVPSLNIIGRLVLQSPFVLEPGEEEKVDFIFFLESGAYEDLLTFFLQKPPVNLSGKATLVLNSAELTLNLSIVNLPIKSGASW